MKEWSEGEGGAGSVHLNNNNISSNLLYTGLRIISGNNNIIQNQAIKKVKLKKGNEKNNEKQEGMGRWKEVKIDREKEGKRVYHKGKRRNIITTRTWIKLSNKIRHQNTFLKKAV